MALPKRLIASLSPSERKILPHLADEKTVQEIAKDADVDEVEAMRACQFLSNKDVLALETETTQHWKLTARGKETLEKGLPETRFYNALDTPKTLDEIREDATLEEQEINAAIGQLKRRGLIEMGEKITRNDGEPPSLENDWEKIRAGDDPLANRYEKRGLVEKEETTTHHVLLTQTGKELANTKLDDEYEERVTHEMLKTGSWKDKQFRRYDVTTPVPARLHGRKHFVNEAIEYIKQLWIEMGFTEMPGTMTQTAFWDLDALFVPQDHPARDMQDTFYLPEPGTLPDWWEDIKAVHETGGDTGSKGWEYTYSKEEAQKVLLRTHTTVLSAQMLKQLDPDDLPAKYFSVAKVFRNETLDWKHLFEFHQVEGIVVGEDLTLADLIGLQKEFYRKMGFEKVRFRPGYFPYTEPSAECEVYHPEKEEWVELGGMGVFRPEVVKPLLGRDVPVLAWGLGMERIITDYYDIDDLRDLYSNDLSQLRTAKAFVPEWD